jgi:hypothetical protein
LQLFGELVEVLIRLAEEVAAKLFLSHNLHNQPKLVCGRQPAVHCIQLHRTQASRHPTPYIIFCMEGDAP